MAQPARLATLPELEAALWRELSRAALDKHHEWRSPVLATLESEPGGDIADARTVVLREVDVEARVLRLFSDARAGKLAQLAAHPAGTLVMWSRRLGWQLRLRVALSAKTEGLAVASRWTRLKLSPAAQDYLSPRAPGSTLTTPLPEGSRDEAPSHLSERAHFAVVEAAVQSVDWLELHAEGHRRARFDALGARWLVP